MWELSTTNKQRIRLIAMAKHGLPSLRWIHHDENFLMRQHTCYFEEHGNLIFPPPSLFSLSFPWDSRCSAKNKRCHSNFFRFDSYSFYCYFLILNPFLNRYIFFSFIPQHLVWFSFYIKFDHYFFYCYFFIFFSISSLNI